MKAKKLLFCMASILLISLITMLGCNQTSKPKGNGVQTKKPDNTKPDSPKPDGTTPGESSFETNVKKELQVTSIKFAEFNVEGKVVPEDFKEVANFSKDKAGPYDLGKPKTAHLSVKVEIEEPDEDDFSIIVENKNTYLQPVRLIRQEGGKDDDRFTSKNHILLSKGKNTIAIKIKHPEGKEIEYRFIAEYDGGPVIDDGKIVKKGSLIPGIYCPAQRKNSKEDTGPEELLMPIFIAGWCTACPTALTQVGKTGNVAKRYASQGLRVVSIDADGTQPEGSYLKWVKDVGKENYPMYSKENNCLIGFFGEQKENSVDKFFPHLPCIKAGEKISEKLSTGDGTYEEYVLRVFKLNKAE